MKPNHNRFCLLIAAIIVLWSCNTRTLTHNPGIDPATVKSPVQFQEKGIFNLGNDIFCSNNFRGARLNEVSLSGDTLITVLIAPENSPVNMSPWYAFKLWSGKQQNVLLNLTYPDGFYHRYHPKISGDGLNWQEVDSSTYKITYNEQKRPVSGKTVITIGPDTLWIAAQELAATNHIETWMNKVASNPFVKKTVIGKSMAGKPIHSLTIGKRNNKQKILIISRQHPPEISGYKAMQAFVETLCSENNLAREFREKFTIHVIPVANPDGVDNGHWRHNNGGIDLNRDWLKFSQPETRVIRDYTKRVIDRKKGKLAFFVDFHSTWKDIYYIPYDREEGEESELVYNLIELATNEIPGYTPDVAKSLAAGSNPKVSSDGYFYSVYGAPSLIYEVGDDTSDDFIRKKAEYYAMKLMELLIDSN